MGVGIRPSIQKNCSLDTGAQGVYPVDAHTHEPLRSGPGAGA